MRAFQTVEPSARLRRYKSPCSVPMYAWSVDDGKTAFHRAESFGFVDQRAVFEIKAVEESVFAAEIDTTINHGCRAIDFESRLVLPDKCAVAGVDAVDVVIETAGDQAVSGDGWRGLKTVAGFVIPDEVPSRASRQ